MFLTLITLSAAFAWTALMIQKEVTTTTVNRRCGSHACFAQLPRRSSAIHCATLLPSAAARLNFGKQIN
jgi:hypothetical protein